MLRLSTMTTLATDPNSTSNPLLLGAYSSAKTPSVLKADDQYTPDASILFVTSGFGAVGLPAIKTFLKSVSAQRDSVESDETLSTLVTNDGSVIEESILTVIHNERMEWLLPECKPTNKRIVVPLVTMTSFCDNKIAFKRVYWDQATVLKQIGVLPTSSYCKALASEMILPVLGTKMADRLKGAVTTFAESVANGASTSASIDEVPTKQRNIITNSAESLVEPVLIESGKEILEEAARELESKPAGLTSRQVNQHNPSLRPIPKTPSRQALDHMNDIFSDAPNQPDQFRPSTRVWNNKPTTNPFEFSSEMPAAAPRPAVNVDPRRFTNQINLFDQTPYTEPKPHRADPNAVRHTAEEDSTTDEPRKIRTSKKPVPDAPATQSAVNLKLYGDIVEDGLKITNDACEKYRSRPVAKNNQSSFENSENGLMPAGHAPVDLNDVAHDFSELHFAKKPAPRGSFASHFTLSMDPADITACSGPEEPFHSARRMDSRKYATNMIFDGAEETVKVRPSSRVLKPPGGGSNIIFG